MRPRAEGGTFLRLVFPLPLAGLLLFLLDLAGLRLPLPLVGVLPLFLLDFGRVGDPFLEDLLLIVYHSIPHLPDKLCIAPLHRWGNLQNKRAQKVNPLCARSSRVGSVGAVTLMVEPVVVMVGGVPGINAAVAAEVIARLVGLVGLPQAEAKAAC